MYSSTTEQSILIRFPETNQNNARVISAISIVVINTRHDDEINREKSPISEGFKSLFITACKK